MLVQEGTGVGTRVGGVMVQKGTGVCLSKEVQFFFFLGGADIAGMGVLVCLACLDVREISCLWALACLSTLSLSV